MFVELVLLLLILYAQLVPQESVVITISMEIIVIAPQPPFQEPQSPVLHAEQDTMEPLVPNAQPMLHLVLQPQHLFLVTVDIN